MSDNLKMGWLLLASLALGCGSPSQNAEDADAGSGAHCGGFAGNTCQADEYCAYEPGDHCGAADATSVCKARPSTCSAEYDPVCGCDGKTYGNACAAANAGTGVLDKGVCK